MTDPDKSPSLTLEQAVGYIFRELRENRGLRQVEVAVATGYGSRTIRSVENAEKSPTLRTMENLAIFYNVPLEELIVRAKKLRDTGLPPVE